MSRTTTRRHAHSGCSCFPPRRIRGDEERFLHLLHLARPDLFDPSKRADGQLSTPALIETLTRTPKSRAVEGGKAALQRTQGHHAGCSLDGGRNRDLRLLTEYILKNLDFVRDSDRAAQLVVQLVMHTFHKIAASSWPALECALQR
jgi:hypothetical protein